MSALPAGLRTTLAELIELYTASLARPTGRSKRASLAMLARELGHHRIAELTPRVFLDFATVRSRAGAAPDPHHYVGATPGPHADYSETAANTARTPGVPLQ